MNETTYPRSRNLGTASILGTTSHLGNTSNLGITNNLGTTSQWIADNSPTRYIRAIELIVRIQYMNQLLI